MGQTLEQDLEFWSDLEVDHVGLITPKFDLAGWDAGKQAVLDAGLRVSSVSCYKEGIDGSAELTSALGCDVLYFPPGRARSGLWEEAAERFCLDVAPWVEHAASVGVNLAVEPTNPLRTDVSFVHCLRDAIDLARTAGMQVVVDVYSTWYERGLEQLVGENIDIVALVQIGDYKLGTFDVPNRCAIGDGDVPVERLVAMLLDAGYQGAFDIEILGPQIEAEGYRAPISRSLQRATEILDRLGA